MATVTHASMHQDHKRWISDNEMLRCDISAWQEQIKQAIADLKEIETALMEHQKALQTHAAAIRLRELELGTHEHALAEYERGETGAELIGLAKTHDKEAAKHAQQRDAHERIRRHHHNVIGQLSLLRKALAAAE
jgi:hypothetical protein